MLRDEQSPGKPGSYGVMIGFAILMDNPGLRNILPMHMQATAFPDKPNSP